MTEEAKKTRRTSIEKNMYVGYHSPLLAISKRYPSLFACLLNDLITSYMYIVQRVCTSKWNVSCWSFLTFLLCSFHCCCMYKMYTFIYHKFIYRNPGPSPSVQTTKDSLSSTATTTTTNSISMMIILTSLE